MVRRRKEIPLNGGRDDDHSFKWWLNQNPADDSSGDQMLRSQILGAAFKWVTVANAWRLVTKQRKSAKTWDLVPTFVTPPPPSGISNTLPHPLLFECPSHLSPSEPSAGRKFKVGGGGIMGKVQHMLLDAAQQRVVCFGTTGFHNTYTLHLKSLDAPQQRHISCKKNRLSMHGIVC